MLKRNEKIDLIKGIGIILMVMGHAGFPATHFIYLFHMAIFFIASGYCYKEQNSSSIKEVKAYVLRKMKNLWIPYVIWTSIYTLLHNLFLKLNIYSNDPLLLKYNPTNHLIYPLSKMEILKNIVKALFLHGGTQMGGAFWFIAVLIEISIIYCLFDYFIGKFLKKFNKDFIQCTISFVLLLIGYVLSIKKVELFGLDKVFSYYSLFYIGIVLKKFNKDKSYNLRFILFNFLILLIGNQLGSIALNENSYCNPIFLLTMSLAGWFFLYECSQLLMENNYLKKFICVVGKHTLSIVVFHFLIFKFINYFIVKKYKLPLCLIASYPILFSNRFWWIVYSLLGVSVPVLLSLTWSNLKDGIKNKVRCYFN